MFYDEVVGQFSSFGVSSDVFDDRTRVLGTNNLVVHCHIQIPSGKNNNHRFYKQY